MPYTGANSERAKHINRSQILSLLLDKGALSRQEICEVTGLTGGGVSIITKQLLALGVIRVIGEDPAAPVSVGRKRILLGLVPNFAYALGVEISPEWIACVVSDLRGDIVACRETPRDEASGPEETLVHVARELDLLCDGAGVGWDQVVGITIGIPGMVDRVSGTVRHSTSLGWYDEPVVGRLTLGGFVPLAAENSGHCMAIADCHTRKADSHDLGLFVYVGRGIGGAITVGKELLRGSENAAGEFGHTLVQPDGPTCRCGRSGCLEALAGNLTTVATARSLFRSERHSRLRELVSHEEDLSVETVVEAAVLGDVSCRELIRDVGRNLGTGIANAVNMLNPRSVIVTGKIVGAGELLAASVRESAESRCIPGPGERVRIEFKPFDKYFCAYGAAVSALQRFFFSPDGVTLQRLVVQDAG